MSKCVCCGSVEFKHHQQARICAYCRTPQEGEIEKIEVTTLADPTRQFIVNQFERYALMRPEAFIRFRADAH